MRLRRLFRLLVLLAAPRLATAQSAVVLEPLRFETGVRGQATDNPFARTRTFEEWLGIQLRGAIVDPRIVAFSLTARPQLIQNRTRASGLETGGSNATWLGFDASADVLRERPLRASLRLTRFTFDERRFGLYSGDLFTTNLSARAIVRYENRLMPLQLDYHEASWGLGQEDDAETGIETFPTRLRTIRLGGANAKTRFSLQQDDNRNSSRLRLRLAEFQNRQIWGKGSSFQFQASALSQTDAGTLDRRNGVLSGNLHLQHLRAVWSDWSAQRLTTRSGASTTAHNYTGALTWQVRPNLVTGVSAFRNVMDFEGGVERQLRIGPNAGVGFRLPHGFRASVFGAVAYQRYSATVTEGARVTVVSERHVLDGAGSFLLNLPDVDPATVLVRGTDGVLYLLGADYDLQETGGYVRVLALPGGRLRAGEAVLVDYQYYPIPSADAPALWAEYSGELDARWLRVFHRRWLIDPTAAYESAPQSSPVRKVDQTTTGVQLTVPAGRVTATARAEEQYRRDATFEVTARSVTSGLNVRLASVLRVGVGGDYMNSRGSTGSTEQVGGYAQLNWMPHYTVQFAATVNNWRALENEAIRRNRLTATGQLIWQPGLLRTTIFYAYRSWQNRDLLRDVVSRLPTHFLVIEISRKF